MMCGVGKLSGAEGELGGALRRREERGAAIRYYRTTHTHSYAGCFTFQTWRVYQDAVLSLVHITSQRSGFGRGPVESDCRNDVTKEGAVRS
jgi:hypothetical protein